MSKRQKAKVRNQQAKPNYRTEGTIANRTKGIVAKNDVKSWTWGSGNKEESKTNK